MRQPDPDCMRIMLARLKSADARIALQLDTHGRNVLHYAAAFGHGLGLAAVCYILYFGFFTF